MKETQCKYKAKYSNVEINLYIEKFKHKSSNVGRNWSYLHYDKNTSWRKLILCQIEELKMYIDLKLTLL